MKLICLYSEPLKGKQQLFPRDIRNYINSIISEEDRELKDFFAWHKRETSPVIYPMPNRKSFAIISYKRDRKTKEYFATIQKLIKESNQLSFKQNNTTATIEEVFIAKQEYCRFESGFVERKTRTPLVIATSVQDYAKARELSKDGNIDRRALEELTRDAITQSIIKTNRDWFDKSVDDEFLDNIMIMFKNDLEYLPIPYKEGEYYAAIKGTIVSNIMLPDFLGYKIGLGYGELMRLKEMQKRGLK